MENTIAKRRTQRMDLRLTPEAKDLLQRAASAKQKTLSEFLIDSGLAAAQEALAGRHVFQLDQAAWAAFLDRLDQPPKPNKALEKLLKSKPVWAE